MIEYRTACPQDMNELIDFINMVFSMLRVPHDFATLLPKVYAGDVPRADIHEIACENGRICGVVALLPFDMKMAGSVLRGGYVGSVSVHPRVRGRGVMRELMQRQMHSAHKQGMDFMILGGQRQRYEYHGFAACGSRMSYSVSKANIRHTMTGAEEAEISFRPLDEAYAEAAYALYEKQPVTGVRTRESFLPSLCSFWHEAWAICERGQMIGYMMASRDGKNIRELVLRAEERLPDVIKAWMEAHHVSPLSIDTTLYDTARNQFLSAISECCTMGTDEMILCLQPDRVIEACLRRKQEALPMEDGVMKLEFGSFGTIRIAVTGGSVSVRRTEEEPDIALDDLRAHTFVFSPDRSAWLAEDMRVPHGWFPLHLQMLEADRF